MTTTISDESGKLAVGAVSHQEKRIEAGEREREKKETKSRTSFLASRPCIFVYNLAVLLGLVGLMLAYFYDQDKRWVPTDLRGLPVYAIWFGALGGLTTSFRAIYDHSRDWSENWTLWHYGRPFSGAVVGGVTFVLFLAVDVNRSTGNVSTPAVLAVAFVFATQERRFMNFASEVAKLVVQTATEEAKATSPEIASIHPKTGIEKDRITIGGKNFGPDTTLLIGTEPLQEMRVSAKGDEISGLVPKRSGKAEVDVVATNPGAVPVYWPGGFEYAE